MIEKLDFHFIANRLEEAADTLKRVPANSGLYKSLTYWPDVVHSFWDAYGWNDIVIRPIPPNAKQISELDETLKWLFHVPGKNDKEKNFYRSVLIARGFGISYRKIGRIVGCSKDKAKQEWMYAVISLVGKLNQNG